MTGPGATRARASAHARFDRVAASKPLVFALCLLPLAWLAWDTLHGRLGTDPVAQLEHRSGDWTLRFLLATLAITPLRRLTKWNELIKIRRMLGLFAFFYATLHMLTWLVFVHFFDLKFMIEDVAERPYITVGMATFLILLTLAVTSNRFSIRKLGRRWQKLHRLVYAAAIGAVIHFWWVVKADFREPRLWALALSVLLGFRAWWTLRARFSPS